MVSVLGFSLLGYLTSVFAVHPIVARYHSSSIAVLVMLLAMAGVIGVIVWYSRLLGQYWLRGDTLLMGFALAQAQRWLGKRREDLSASDQDFINQSGAQQRAIGLRFAILFMFVTSWTILNKRYWQHFF